MNGLEASCVACNAKYQINLTVIKKGDNQKEIDHLKILDARIKAAEKTARQKRRDERKEILDVPEFDFPAECYGVTDESK